MTLGFLQLLKAIPWPERPAHPLRLVVLPTAILPAILWPPGLVAAAPAISPSPAAQAAATPTPPPLRNPTFVVVRADQQGYDQQLGRFVATGNVEAEFNGWRLLADRVELAERSRSVFA